MLATGCRVALCEKGGRLLSRFVPIETGDVRYAGEWVE
jgi:hypothetical protein